MLNKYRAEIDKIDRKLVDLLSKRGKISKKIGIFKKEKGLEIHNLDRETELISNLEEIGVGKGLNKKYIKDVFQVILRESRRIQNG